MLDVTVPEKSGGTLRHFRGTFATDLGTLRQFWGTLRQRLKVPHHDRCVHTPNKTEKDKNPRKRQEKDRKRLYFQSNFILYDTISHLILLFMPKYVSGVF